MAGLEDQGFCGRCWLSIPRIQGLVCQTCGIPLKFGGNICHTCRLTPPPLVVRAATEYRGAIPSAVYRFKYGGRKSLAKPLAALLRYAWSQSPEIQQIQGLIPVPLHPKNERIRGFNQAELLTAELSRHISRPIIPLLIRTRRTPSQVELNRAERQQNVRSAFALHPLAHAKRSFLNKSSFLLIDDICTTASTLSECARVLRQAGARSVKALVLARDL